ncbi:helix-turn-helix domain-containing protein, partial [Paenibacillus sp. MZ04-78.2]
MYPTPQQEQLLAKTFG